MFILRVKRLFCEMFGRVKLAAILAAYLGAVGRRTTGLPLGVTRITIARMGALETSLSIVIHGFGNR